MWFIEVICDFFGGYIKSKNIVYRIINLFKMFWINLQWSIRKYLIKILSI